MPSQGSPWVSWRIFSIWWHRHFIYTLIGENAKTLETKWVYSHKTIRFCMKGISFFQLQGPMFTSPCMGSTKILMFINICTLKLFRIYINLGCLSSLLSKAFLRNPSLFDAKMISDQTLFFCHPRWCKIVWSFWASPEFRFYLSFPFLNSEFLPKVIKSTIRIWGTSHIKYLKMVTNTFMTGSFNVYHDPSILDRLVWDEPVEIFTVILPTNIFKHTIKIPCNLV